jgi:hypothetical protein
MPWYIHSLRRIYHPGCHAGIGGTKYALAVAEPYTAGRLLAAWWVLTGRAYAFQWPKPGDLEAAIGMPLWDRAATVDGKSATVG